MAPGKVPFRERHPPAFGTVAFRDLTPQETQKASWAIGFDFPAPSVPRQGDALLHYSALVI